jgi:hypothetical protein
VDDLGFIGWRRRRGKVGHPRERPIDLGERVVVTAVGLFALGLQAREIIGGDSAFEHRRGYASLPIGPGQVKQGSGTRGQRHRPSGCRAVDRPLGFLARVDRALTPDRGQVYNSRPASVTRRERCRLHCHDRGRALRPCCAATPRNPRAGDIRTCGPGVAAGGSTGEMSDQRGPLSHVSPALLAPSGTWTPQPLTGNWQLATDTLVTE